MKLAFSFLDMNSSWKEIRIINEVKEMAFNLFGGKRRITKGFFANSLGNKQTRGVYTFQIDVENGELIF